MPNGARALPLIGLSTLFACASASPVEERLSPPAAPTVAIATPSLSASAAPGATAPLAEPLFSEVGVVPLGAELYPMDGTLAALDIRWKADATGVEAFVYELAQNKFTLVGAAPFPVLTQIESIEGKAGGPIAVVSLEPYGRGVMRTRTPVRGGGRPKALGDPMSALFEPPDPALEAPHCGEAVGANKLLPMKQWSEHRDVDSVLFAGESCDGKRVLQVLAKRGATPSSRELEPWQGLVEGTRGLYLVGERIEHHRGGGVDVVAESTPSALHDPKEWAALFIYDLPDGSLIVHRGKHAFFWRDRRWVEALLPSRVSAGALIWDGQTLWAREGTGLYRFTPAGTPKQAPIDVSALKDVAAEADAPPPPALAMKTAGPQCKSNVVVLYGFTKVTPLDYDYPLTRKALKGHLELKGTRFAVTEDGGKRYFVGFPPSFKVAQDLVKVVSAGVNGSKPQVVCAEPKIIRPLELDLATGELK